MALLGQNHVHVYVGYQNEPTQAETELQAIHSQQVLMIFSFSENFLVLKLWLLTL